MGNLPRRTLMGGAAAVVGAGAGAAALAGCSGEDDAPGGTDSRTGDAPGGTETPARRRQAGVDTPLPRQRYLALRILTLPDPADGEAVRVLLGALEAAVAALPDDATRTVTVGVGPAVVRAGLGADAVGATDLPAFASDALEDDAEGGDLMLQVCSDRRADVLASADTLEAALADDGAATPSWSLDGYRGEVDGIGARNVLGFYDGLAVPTTPPELDEAVWTEESDGLADATICVVRRIRLDHRRFGLLPVARQQDVIGRFKRSGAPLSGGGIEADVNLQAKSDSGVYDIPNDAHVRRAHPLFSGAGRLMMRRGYSYRNGPDDQGLAFICFQRDLTMFVRTQQSMDGGDRLLDFATTTGSATFLVLPAADAEHALGSDLFA